MEARSSRRNEVLGTPSDRAASRCERPSTNTARHAARPASGRGTINSSNDSDGADGSSSSPADSSARSSRSRDTAGASFPPTKPFRRSFSTSFFNVPSIQAQAKEANGAPSDGFHSFAASHKATRAVESISSARPGVDCRNGLATA